MRALLAVLVIGVLGSVAFADDSALVKQAREEGLVLADGKGHYIVFPSADPASPESPEAMRMLWYGDGKTFHALHWDGISNDGGSAEYMLADPRVGNLTKHSLLVATRDPRMICDGRVTPLTVVPGADARKLLAKAAFKGRYFDRMARLLGRDGTTYYLVDTARSENVVEKVRLFVGKRGAMKEIKVTRVDTDEKRLALTTAKGVLHAKVVRTKSGSHYEPSWTPKGGTPLDLVNLHVRENSRLVYTELGVYPARLGYPCDDM